MKTKNNKIDMLLNSLQTCPKEELYSRVCDIAERFYDRKSKTLIYK